MIISYFHRANKKNGGRTIIDHFKGVNDYKLGLNFFQMALVDIQ
jgi:hypothetical protein